jgi:hypothetical protein
MKYILSATGQANIGALKRLAPLANHVNQALGIGQILRADPAPQRAGVDFARQTACAPDPLAEVLDSPSISYAPVEMSTMSM